MGTYTNNGNSFLDPGFSTSESLDTSGSSFINGSPNSTASIFRETIGGGDSFDTYRFTVSSSSIVSLSLTDANSSSLTNSADLALRSSSDTPIVGSIQSGSSPRSINVALAAGTYYARVYSAASIFSYDLSFSAIPVQDQGRLTTDNSTSNAFIVTPQFSSSNTTFNTSDFVGENTSISNSNVIKDANDYYEINLATSGQLNITLNSLTANADLRLLTSGLSQLNTSTNPGNTSESITTNSIAAGKYYIQVYANTSAGNFTNYNLNVAFNPDPADNGGNSTTTATPINSISFNTSDFVSSGDTNDYYKLDLTTLTNSDALVNINLQPASSNADLTLYDSSGVATIQSSKQLGTAQDTIRRSLTKGVYYILVSSVGGAATNYQLNVNTQQINPDQAANTQNTATTINNISNFNTGDFIGNIDSNDFYTFTLNSFKQFSLNLNNLSDNATVELYNTSRTVNQTISGSAINNSVSLNTSLNIGTYYVRVYTTTSPIANTFYNLSISTNSATQKFDLNTGSGSSNPDNLTALGDNLYFTANDGSTGSQLWRVTNGSSPTRLTAINPGAFNPSNLIAFNNNLYFTATDSRGTELWVYNGTTTSLLSDINLGSGSSNPSDLTVVGSQLFFSADSGSGKKVWVYNGSTVTLVSGNYSNPTNLTAFDNKLYFKATSTNTGNELWSTNGNGTQVIDVIAGSVSSSPTNLTAVGSTLYFTTNEGRQLWKYTSGASTPTVLKDFTNTSATFAINYMTSAGNTLYFAIDSDSDYLSELWKSDGTSVGTVKVIDDFDPNTESDTSFASSFNKTYTSAIGNILYLSVNNTSSGWELWKTDGNPTTSGLVKDIWTGDIPGGTSFSNPNNSRPESLVNFNGTLYFVASNSNTSREVWKSDGTALGTSKVTTINSSGNANPAKLTVVGTQLYFIATDGTSGTELYAIS